MLHMSFGMVHVEARYDYRSNISCKLALQVMANPHEEGPFEDWETLVREPI